MRYLLLLLLLLAIAACTSDPPPDTTSEPALFEQISMQHSGINFINEIQETRDFNIFSYRNFYNGGGVAIGDIDQDGLADIYLTRNMGPNKLYRNKGNFQFEDITGKGWGRG